MTLLEAKARRALTWTEVSARTGISKVSLSLIANGKVFPRAKNRTLINEALDVEIDWIETRITKQLNSKAIKRECPEDTVICAINEFIKKPGDTENRFMFLYEFLSKLEEYLKCER